MSPARKKKTEEATPATPPAKPSATHELTEQQRTLAKSAANVIQKMTGQKRISEHIGALPYIPSGSTTLDMLIGGSSITEDGELVCPGYPTRRIIEIYGPESSGKTTVALSAIAQVQARGGVAMLIDMEHALNHRYARACGVRFDESLLLYEPDSMEECFKMMLIGITLGLSLVVVDSVAAMVPAAELDKKMDDAAKIGVVARLMSINLPKFALWLSKYPQDKDKKSIPNHPGTTLILLNQERAKIDTSGGGGGGGEKDPNTSGGKALKFFSYLRLRFSKIRSEYVKRKDPSTGKEKSYPYGNLTQVKIVKTKVVGNQGDTAPIFIRYGFGLDDIYSLIEVGKGNRIIRQEGAFLTFDGERWQGKDKLRAYLLSSPTTLAKLRQEVIESLAASAVKPIRDEDLNKEDEVVEMLQNQFGDEDNDGNDSENEGDVETDAEDVYTESAEDDDA